MTAAEAQATVRAIAVELFGWKSAPQEALDALPRFETEAAIFAAEFRRTYEPTSEPTVERLLKGQNP